MPNADQFLDQFQPPSADAFLAQYDPHPNAAVDASQSLLGGVERGAAALPMVLPNLINQAVAGPQLLGRGVAEHLDKLAGVEPQPRGDVWQPFYGSEDALKQLPEALQPHTPQTAAGVGADLIGQFAGNVVAGKGIQGAENSMFAADTSSGKPTSGPAFSADDVRQFAHHAYSEAEAKGGTLRPEATNYFLNKTTGMLPQTPEGKLVLGETPTTKLIDRLQVLRDKPLSLGAAKEMDEAIGNQINNEVDLKTGRMSQEGRKLFEIQSALRDTIENASPKQVMGGTEGFDALKRARELWSTSARMGDVERIVTRAEMMDNPVTGLKTGFRNLYNNPSRMRGFSDEEGTAIKNAGETGLVGNTLRLMGSRLVPIFATLMGGAEKGGLALGVNEVGRGVGGNMQSNKATKVLDLLANRPAVQQAAGITPPPPPVYPSLKPAVAASFLATQGSQ